MRQTDLITVFNHIYRFIQEANMELPPKQQITPSNIYSASFQHLKEANKMAVLQFWVAHHAGTKNLVSTLFMHLFIFSMINSRFFL
jgi:uncharacterized protein YfbU (UPF0304 family)